MFSTFCGSLRQQKTATDESKARQQQTMCVHVPHRTVVKMWEKPKTNERLYV